MAETRLQACSPPFAKDASLYHTSIPPGNAPHGSLLKLQDLLPAAFFPSGRNNTWTATINRDFDNSGSCRPQADISVTVAREISLPGLIEARPYLWCCARPQPAPALHVQIMMNRNIVVTEQPHLHLVRPHGRIFIKPLPKFLVCYDFWDQYLCQDQDVYKCAAGFLLSYIWLIRHRGGLAIAKEHRLVPSDLEWKSWVDLVDSVLQFSEFQNIIDPRYRYGETSLPRLNVVCRYAPDVGGFSFKPYLHGYGQGSHFFKRNFAWIGIGLLYLTVVLTAMQVDLAIPNLADSRPFDNASYGFSVFCMVLPLAMIFQVVIRHFYWMLTFRLKIMRCEDKAPHRGLSPWP